MEPALQPAAELDDEALVVKVGAGDQHALRVLHERHAPLVFGIAARVVDEATAEEVVQDVFLTVWQKHASFDPGRGSFRSWIVQIARRRALNALRGDRKHKNETDDALPLRRRQRIHGSLAHP